MNNSKNSLNSTYNIAIIGLFAAISIVLIMIVRIPLFPSASWLEYDLADIPILLVGYIVHPIAGFLVLAVAAVIQAFTVSAQSGWIGLLMHLISSGALVLVSCFAFLFMKKIAKNEIIRLVISLVLGGLVMVVVMIPLNLIFTPMLTGAPVSAVKELLVPAIIPFNLIKAAVNTVALCLIYYPVKMARNFF